jgi:hypothetical protein
MGSMGYYGIYGSGCVLWLQKQVLLMVYAKP